MTLVSGVWQGTLGMGCDSGAGELVRVGGRLAEGLNFRGQVHPRKLETHE